MSSNRVAGVGKLIIRGNTAIKEVQQTTRGSAYMKIPGMLISIHQAGFERTILRINKDHPYLLRIEDHVNLIRQTIPSISIEKF